MPPDLLPTGSREGRVDGRCRFRVWLRSSSRPRPGHATLGCDFSSTSFGILATRRIPQRIPGQPKYTMLAPAFARRCKGGLLSTLLGSDGRSAFRYWGHEGATRAQRAAKTFARRRAASREVPVPGRQQAPRRLVSAGVILPADCPVPQSSHVCLNCLLTHLGQRERSRVGIDIIAESPECLVVGGDRVLRAALGNHLASDQVRRGASQNRLLPLLAGDLVTRQHRGSGG